MARPVPKYLSRLLDPYCITKGGKFRLEDVDPGDYQSAYEDMIRNTAARRSLLEK